MTINRTRIMAAGLAVVLSALVGCTNPGHVDANLPQAPLMTSEQLRDMRTKGEKIVVLDVREENEYKEVHITDAIWFPKSKFDKKDAGLQRTLAGLDNACSWGIRPAKSSGLMAQSAWISPITGSLNSAALPRNTG